MKRAAICAPYHRGDVQASASRSIGGSTASDIVVITDGGGVAQYDGVGWTNLPNGTGLNGNHVSVAGGEAVAVGGGGRILERSNGTWRATSAPTLRDLFGVHVYSGRRAFVVGDAGMILY